MNWTLPTPPPFSLASIIRSHGWIQLAPFRQDEQNGGFSHITELDSGRVLELRVQEADGGVNVEVAKQISRAEQKEIIRKIQWMLGLDQNFSEFYALAQQEPKLAKVVEKAQGRILRSPTLFEDTVKTILTTNTLWGGTIRMVAKLVSLYGAPLPGDSGHHAFPTPQKLAKLDVDKLRSEARLGYRSPYILELARSIDSGGLDLEALKASPLPTLELRKQLLQIKGVGDYAVANLMILLGRYDYLPVDSWALKMVSQEWHGGQPIGRAEVEAAFERWGSWKGLVYWFWEWS